MLPRPGLAGLRKIPSAAETREGRSSGRACRMTVRASPTADVLRRGMKSSLGRDIRTIPNLITLSRIVLLLVAATIYFSTAHRGVAIALAVIAGVTDYLDGAIARATGQVTRLGEILDLFCDLCFESLALTVAIHAGFFPAYFILLYLFREFWVLTIRRSMAHAGKNIPSSLLGKLKTNLVMWGFLPTFL